MTNVSAVQNEVEFTDRFGDKRVIHRRVGGGLAVKRTTVTPVLALNQHLSGLVGARVRAARIDRGLTLAELAERAGLVGGKQYMWGIENATRDKGVTVGTLFALAMALGVEAGALLPTVAEAEVIAKPQKNARVAVALVRP